MNHPPNPVPDAPQLTRKHIAAVAAVLVLLVGFSLAARVVSRRFAPNPREGWRARSADIRARQGRLSRQPWSDPTRPYLAEGCAQVADRFGLRSDLSREQAARVWQEQYAGRWVRWAVSANRVDQLGTGGRAVQYKCSDRSFAFDGTVFFAADQQAAVRQVAPNTVIELEGQLAFQDSLLGVQVQRAVLLR